MKIKKDNSQPYFSLIVKGSNNGIFDFLMEEPPIGKEFNANSKMLKILMNKYNEIAKHLNDN